MRVKSAEIGIVAGLPGGEAVAVAGIERLRAERTVAGDDEVRDVVVVLEGNGRARLYHQDRRGKGEIVDFHQHRLRRMERRRGHEGETEAGAEGGMAAGTELLAEHGDFLSSRAQASVLSTIASSSLPFLMATSVTPSRPRSLPEGTVIGPGDFAVPGAGCGKAVERAVWK